MKHNGYGKRLAALGIALLAAGCGKSAVPADLGDIAAARKGVEFAADMAAGAPGKPGAALGVFASDFLLHASTIDYHSAMDGVTAQMQMFLSGAEQQNAVFAAIEDLGSALQVNINDLLNNSANRQETLDTYAASLKDLLQKAQEKSNELDQEADGVNDALRAVRRAASKKQSDINKAVRTADYTTAGSLQQELLTMQAEESRQNADAEQLKGQIDLLSQLIDVGTERWNAITKNREALVAGVEVINVPGVEDLGILRKETSEERRARNSNQGIFGGLE